MSDQNEDLKGQNNVLLKKKIFPISSTKVSLAMTFPPFHFLFKTHISQQGPELESQNPHSEKASNLP